MGRRKGFIDRRRSETYQLIYRSTNEDDGVGEERVLVEQGAVQGALPTVPHAAATSSSTCTLSSGVTQRALLFKGAPPPFPFSFEEEELTDAQKDEIRELGLPLDGYNYLQHLRTLGSGRTELPVPKQGAVFVESTEFSAPPPETRFLNAKGLIIHSAALNDEEAEDTLRSGTTTAFSRVVPSVKGATQQEICDVEALFDKFEGLSVEEGDLLDNFVLDATRADPSSTLSAGTRTLNKQDWTAIPEDLSSDEEEEALMEHKSVGRSRFSRGDLDSQSSFSERWRGTDASDFEGRKQRTRPLEIVDEMFESILEDYDEEEMGELDDEVDDGMSLEQLSQCLRGRGGLYENSFQPEAASRDGQSQRPPKKIGSYRLLKPKRRVAALRERDTKAVEATKKLATAKEMGSKREEWEDILVSVRSDRELDCESALSYRSRSTIYQPSLIVVSQKAAHKPTSLATDPVKVSSKSGMPVGESESREEMKSEEEDDGETLNVALQLHCRQKNECSEEKRQRKQAVKEAKRESRMRKKENKALYAQERARQQKQMAGMLTKNASVVTL